MDMSFDMVLKVFVLLGLSCHFSAIGASVSQTSCNNDNECSSISNSACVSSHCKCNDGYNETSTTCSKVIGAACAVASDCLTIVPNSNCSSATCACSPLYQEKNDMCVKAAVSLTTCTTNGNECIKIKNAECTSNNCKCKAGFRDNAGACTKVLGAVCQTNASCSKDVPNSECKTLKCVCAKGYGESDDACAKPVSQTPCTTSGTECKSISNSACDKKGLKCKCDAGFKETVNKCTTESKGITLSSTTTTVLTGVLLLVFALNKLF